jgi:hypothetical protein
MYRKLIFSPPSSLKAAEHLGKTQPPLPPLLMRKLSFDTGGEDSAAAAAMKPAASPDTMPGEIFQLENIVEEPVGKQQKQCRASCRIESCTTDIFLLPLSSSPFLHT